MNAIDFDDAPTQEDVKEYIVNNYFVKDDKVFWRCKSGVHQLCFNPQRILGYDIPVYRIKRILRKFSGH